MVACAVRTVAGVADAARIGGTGDAGPKLARVKHRVAGSPQTVERKATLLVEEALITRKARTLSPLVTATALPAVVVAVAASIVHWGSLSVISTEAPLFNA